MNIYTLFEDCFEAVRSDQQLQALSTINYGQEHKAYIDPDQENPPGESDAPNIQFHSPTKTVDEDRRIVEYGFFVFIIINDANQKIRTDEDIIEHAATEKLIEFIERILTVIRSAKPANFVMTYTYESDTLTSYPDFESDIFIGFREQLTIGQDPFT